ncbi:MAG: Ig-like domain-containing protein [Nitrosomonadales bacterium]|nr:Ig-like domain-containing protein [Nitrosomonadales bacterium]
MNQDETGIDTGGVCGGGASPTTTISGKVTLSSAVTGKPVMMAAMLNKARLQQAGKGKKPAANQGSNLLKALSATTLGATALNSATIELYDADKPEWLSPVAVALSDGTGTYTLDALINGASNLQADGITPGYTDGDPIPTGNYTVIASKYDSGYGKLFVAVQAIVKKFSGAATGNDLEAQDSNAIPSVISMLGLSKNADGTFGSSTTPVPVNANIQVTFSMAMARVSVVDGMTIAASDGTVVSGKWKVAPDLSAVTFYPTSDLTPNTVYTITVGGGKSLKTAKNVYGKAIAADVKGTFKSSAKDLTPPSVIRNSPTTAFVNSMPITTPIRIGADEEIDITSFVITSSPSIGDKPAIKYVGLSAAAADVNYPYIYEIVPSSTLQLATPYTVGVSGGLDMAGNAMVGSTAINFTTETTSAGVTGTTTTEINAQLGAKDVLGKWVSAMNARNSALLSTYMSGGFFWINDTTAHGMQSEDLNKDGRLSLNEFTFMLDNWFKDLDRCGSTVTGDVDTANTNVPGGIAVNGATATIAFNLTATPTNTTDPTCADSGPKSALYAVMENINQTWLMTRGSEIWLTTYPAALTPIDLLSPANGNQFADPSLTPGTPLIPEFKWTAVDVVAGTPASTYLVVLIDNNSRQLQRGWAALVDGSATAAGTPMAVKFNGTPGDYGTMSVLCLSQDQMVCPGGNNNPLGFQKMISEIKSGGSYSWAVIGFKTKTIADFKNLNFDPAAYLVASSASNGFTVNGVWKALTISVVGSPSGTSYTYSDNAGGYNVGADNSVTLTVVSPNSTAVTGGAYVNGYTSTNYPLNFAVVNGVNTATATIALSNKRNWVDVGDGSGTGIGVSFGIFTTGGTMPKIGGSAGLAVTAKTCTGGVATLGTQDAWGSYTTADTCTVSVSGSLDLSITGTLYINVGNNNGLGNYNNQITLAPGATSFSVVDIPVYKGQNWVSISNWNNTTSENNWNGFNVDTQAGSTYVQPITATVTGLTATSTDFWQSSWDAGAAASVTLNVTMPSNNGMGNNGICDQNWMNCQPLTITGTALNAITVTLNNGWNYISLSDGANNWYTVNIYTTGGTVYTPPNVVTSVTGGVATGTPAAGGGYFQYDAGSSCTVTVNGTTTSALPMNVYMNYYNSTTFASVSEWQSVTPTGLVSPYSYSFTQNVYTGINANSIDIYDGNWSWQGVQVSTTCATGPVVFGVNLQTATPAGVTDGTSALTADAYGTYNTTVSTVTVNGTAKTGSTITAYVSGLYYGTVTTTASAGTYSINLPIYTGYNYISLTDGSNWSYLNVSTTGGTAYTPPINAVTVSGSTLSSGGGVSDTWSSWNTNLGIVDIGGSASVNGTGTYYLSGSYTSTSGSLTISGGAFSLTGVVLDYGYNYITLYDANWNSYSLTIYTTGGTNAPVKVVAITSPLQSATASGAVVVTGTIDTAFAPVYVYAYTYDYTTGLSTYYSNQAADQAAGYQPLTYSAGTFSFSASVTAGDTTVIETYAYDANWLGHGHGIYVNNPAGYTDYFYKPGSKASAGSAKAKAHRTEFVKRMKKH